MSEGVPGGGDFRIFIQKIALQGFYALGLVEIPGAPKPEKPNLAAARMVVEDLKMLRDKTRGQLDPGEELTPGKHVPDLQFRSVERDGQSGKDRRGSAGAFPHHSARRTRLRGLAGEPRRVQRALRHALGLRAGVA